MIKYSVNYRVREDSIPVPLINVNGTLQLDESYMEIFRFFDTFQEAEQFIQENSGNFILPNSVPLEIFFS
jgi:hypothetical protein